MRCFKCGAQLAPGQKICSICDTDNSKQIYEEGPSYNYEQVNYDNSINEVIKNEDEVGLEKESSNKGSLISVVIILIVFIVAIFGIKLTINNINNNKKKVENKENEIFKLYKKIKNDIEIKINLGEEIVCDINCDEYYDFNNDVYSLIVDEDEDYYIIELTDNINNIDLSLCSSDLKCDESTIIGYIEK